MPFSSKANDSQSSDESTEEAKRCTVLQASFRQQRRWEPAAKHVAIARHHVGRRYWSLSQGNPSRGDQPHRRRGLPEQRGNASSRASVQVHKVGALPLLCQRAGAHFARRCQTRGHRKSTLLLAQAVCRSEPSDSSEPCGDRCSLGQIQAVSLLSASCCRSRILFLRFSHGLVEQRYVATS